ncbi:uncharacterized protein LOC143894168 isoform X1 [Temnothorax americanus]|uniref:uncharacterized protein LOC143894168 isoform X1 n=2 Tax=Temnothorax americanus TaxID=1964332 RepID=UPI00406826A3
MRAAQVCDDATCDERSKVSLQSILQATGVPLEQAEKHATIIQAAFRGHYERMLLNESRGMIQWQRAAARTLEILKKAGASQAEASKATILIQATYRGYYTRRNLKMKMKDIQPQEEEKESEVDIIEPGEAVQAVAWLDTMYEESGLTPMRANEAASVIQKAYRRYRQKRSDANPSVESTRSAVAGAILKNLHQKVFDEVMARVDIPTEFGDREDLMEAGEELQRVFNNRLMHARLAEKEYSEENLVHVEEFDESFEKLMDNGMYWIGMAEDWQEGREIEVESERDEETDTYVQD